MIDHVRNFISVYGNDEVRSLVPEICRRLELDADIGAVLYGESFENKPDECLKKTGAYFVEPSQNFGWWGEEVTFISGQNIPTKLVTHIVWFLSKVDPNVVVCNRYDHEEGSFVGVEYQIVRNNKIRFFDDVSEIHLKVLCDDEIEPFLDEHGSESDAITWEQVWEMQLVNGKNALTKK